MALNIVINTEQANNNVDKLGQNIVQLGDKAEQAGKRAKAALDFGQLAKAEISALRASFRELEGMTNSLAAALKREAGVMSEVRKAKRDFVGEAQKASRAVLDETKAMQKLTDQTHKAQEGIKQYARQQRVINTEAQRYTQTLDQQNVAMSQSAQRLLSAKKGWSDMTREQQAAARETLRLNQALNSTKGLIKEQLSPLEKYNSHLRNLQIAREAYIKSEGRAGISQLQYMRGVQAANVQLAEYTKRNLTAGQALRHFTENTNLGQQATAGFRAVLAGANASFGIFTSSTILTAAALYALTKAVTTSIMAGASFERSFERSAAIMGEFKNVAAAGEKPLYQFTAAAKLVREEVIRLGKETQYSAEQVSEAVRYLAASGYSAAEVMNSLEAVVTLGAVAFIELDQAADMAANILRAFGKSSGELMHIVNMMAVAVNESNVNMQQLAKSMTYVGPAANAAGVSIEQTTAAIAVLANVGIKGSMAGTALRRIITSLANPSDAAVKALGRLKVEIAHTDSGGVDLVETFNRLNKAGADLGDLHKIFGLWAVSAAAAIVKFSGVDQEFAKFQQRLLSVQDDAVKMRQALQDNVIMSLERVKSSFNAIQITAFDKAGPRIKEILDQVDAALDNNAKEIAEWISNVTVGIAKGVKFVIDHFQTIANFLMGWGVAKLLGKVMSGLAAAFGTISPAKKLYLAMLAQEEVATNAATASLLRYTEAQLASAAAATTASRTRLAAAGAAASMPLVAGAAGPGRFQGANAMPLPKVDLKELQNITKGAAAATGALALLGRGFTALVGVVRGALAALGGIPGILLTIASFLAIEYVTSSEKAETATDQLSASIDQFNLALEDNARVLNNMSKDSLLRMQQEMVKARDVAIAATADVEKEIKGLEDRQRQLKELIASEANKPNTGGLLGRYMGGGVSGDVRQAQAALVEITNKLAEAEERRVAAQIKINQQNKNIALNQDAVNAITKAGVTTVGDLASNYVQLSDEMVKRQYDLDTEAKLAGLSGKALIRKKLELEAETGAIKAQVPAIDALIERQQKEIDTLKDGSPEKAAAIDMLNAQTRARDLMVKGLEKAEIERLTEIFYEGEQAKKARETAAAYKTEGEQLSGLALKLQDLNNFQKSVLSEGSALVGYLAQLGISATAAKKALTIKTDEMRLDYLTDVLAEIDPRFKSLNETIRKTSESALSFDDVMKIASDVLEKTGLHGEALKKKLLEIAPAIRSVADGTAEANKRADQLIQSTNEEIAKFGKLDYTIEGVTAAFGKMDVEKAKALATALKLKKALEVFGPIMQEMQTDTEKTAEAQDLLNAMIERFPEHADKATEAMKRWIEANTAIGQVTKSIEQIQGQMNALASGGPNSLEEYNRLWELTGGHIENASDELKKLVHHETVMKQLQKAYADLWGGLEDTVRGVMDGTLKSSKDVLDKLKDVFKQFLVEMAMIAMRNVIQVQFSGQNSGGGGFMNMLGSMFGGGGGQGGGGGNIIGSIVSMLGNSGGGGGGGNIMSMLGGGNNNLMGMFGGNGGGIGGGLLSQLTGGGMNASAMQSYGVLNNATGYGPWRTPTGTAGGGLGMTGTVLAGLGGAIYGYNRTNGGAAGVGAGLAYGAGGIALAGTAAGLAGGASLGAAAGGAFSALGGAAFIPVVGWILAAIAAVDMITGGKVFGTKYRPDKAVEELRIGAQGGDARSYLTEVRQRSLFRGRQWRTTEQAATAEAEGAADALFDSVKGAMTDAAERLKIDVPPVIDAAIRTVVEYDKKGKVKTTQIMVDILGRSFKAKDAEEAATRIIAESLLAVVDAAMQQTVTLAKPIRDTAIAKIMAAIEPGEGGGGGGRAGGDIDTANSSLSEVHRIAQRWRSDAALLLEGAQFLVQAQAAIAADGGLLGAGGTLTATTDFVEDMQRGEETLSDTFNRLMTSTVMLRNALELTDMSVGVTGEEFVELAQGIVDQAGSLEAASALWDGYYARFYTQQDRSRREFDNLIRSRNEQLRNIGLNPTITKDEFKEQFTERLPDLNAEEIVEFLQAANALADVSDALNGIIAGLTEQLAGMVTNATQGTAALFATDEAFQTFLSSIDETINRLREFGGDEALNNFRAAFTSSIDSQLGWRQYVIQLKAVDRQYEANMRTARALGMTTQQLVRIEALAALQRAKIMDEINSSIVTMLGQLHELDQDAADRAAAELAALEGATATSDEFWTTTNEGLEDALAAQRSLFEAAQAAIKDITDFLNSININEMSPESLETRMNESRRQFDDLVRRALAGDTDAMSQLTQAAQSYLSLGQEYFGSTVGYADIFEYVNTILDNVRSMLGQIPDPGPSLPTDGGGGGGGTTTTDTDVITNPYTEIDEERERRNRHELALTIAERIGQLNIATGRDIYDLMESFDTSIIELATNLGINLDELDERSAFNIALLAEALNTTSAALITALDVDMLELATAFGISLETYSVANTEKIGELGALLGLNILDLTNQLGFDLIELGNVFGVNTQTLGQQTVEALGAMATALGADIYELMTAMGVNIVGLAESIGLSMTELNSQNWAQFVMFAETLGTDVVTLATTIGATIDQIGQLITSTLMSSLEALPGLAPELLSDIGPLLEAIRAADTTAEINEAIQDLRDYASALPEDQRDLLEPIFDQLLGSSGLAGDVTAVQQTIEEIGMSQIEIQTTISQQSTLTAERMLEANGYLSTISTLMTDYLASQIEPPAAITEELAAMTGAYGDSASQSAAVAESVAVSARVQSLQESAAAVQAQDMAAMVDAAERAADNTGKTEEAVKLLTQIIANQQQQIIELQKQNNVEQKKKRVAEERKSIPNNTGRGKKSK